MEKKKYYISVAIVAVVLSISLGIIFRSLLNEFGCGSRYENFFYLDNIDSTRAYSLIMDELGISPFKGLELKRIGLSASKDRVLYAKISIDKSLLCKFKNSLRFKSMALKFFHELLRMGDFTTISSSEIDCIDECVESKIRIVYMKERNGEIVIFISKKGPISGEIYSLFHKP